jgi:hypothetical protein
MDGLGSPSPSQIEDAIMKKSQTRVGKTLRGGPEFILSVEETQNILYKFANSKIDLVILNVDLVASTKLSMTLPLDKLTIMIQSFNQEMSLIVRDFGGFVLKRGRCSSCVLCYHFCTSISKENGMHSCN